MLSNKFRQTMFRRDLLLPSQSDTDPRLTTNYLRTLINIFFIGAIDNGV